MNTKTLLSTLLALLSGCASYSPSTLTVATGGGAVGLGQITGNKTARVETYPSRFNHPVTHKKTSRFKETPASYSESDEASSSQAEEMENVDFQNNPHALDTPSPSKYSQSSKKNSPTANRNSSAGNPSRYVVSGENYKVLPFSHGFVERGIASWYGPDFHGEKTSNGETYNMYDMTAAHKNLPIPSYVRVTNLKNKRSVVLRINDRGPFYPDRVIDLSYAAAQKLDIHQPGTEMVEIEAIKTSNKESVYLQLGVFSNPANAQMLQKKVAKNAMPEPMVKEVLVAGKLAYRVQLGPIFSPDKVDEFNAKLAKMGISETWYVTENSIN